MDYQEWEFFESEIDRRHFFVADTGPLFGPISSFDIKRDEQLQIVLTTVSEGGSQKAEGNQKINAVEIIDGEVIFQDRYSDAKVVAKGVAPGGFRTKYIGPSTNNPATSTTEQNSRISTLHWTSHKGSEGAAYTIEWLENLSGKHIWPHSDHTEETIVKEREIGKGEEAIIIRSENPSTIHSNSCARIVIDDLTFIIGESRKKHAHIKNPGFILYLGIPDEETRMKVRGCLSFLLGDYLLYLGWTCFDLQWKPVSFCAVSAHALVDEATRISGRPPTPLGMTYQREIDPSILSKMVTSLLKIHDEYELRAVFWNYWHAKAAPVHMAAAHFGAAIEALQRAYFKKNGVDGSSRIVNDNNAWQTLSEQIAQCITNANLTAEEKRLLTNKARQLNSAPQSVASERFFDSLSLKIGALEKQAWGNRNRAAHGSHVPADRVAQLIRENKILMTLVHRILLSLSNASHLYYDYYTLGFTKPTTQHLIHALPDQNTCSN